MRLWIKLLPEKNFPLKIKLKLGITLCYFNLLESYFRSFDHKIRDEVESITKIITEKDLLVS